MVMVDFFSEDREPFYQGAVSSAAFFNTWSLLTYVVYGANVCKWNAESCDDLVYGSVGAFALLTLPAIRHDGNSSTQMQGKRGGRGGGGREGEKEWVCV